MEFLLEIGAHIRKSVRTCYRSLLHHPVLAAFLVFLTFLHRFFPFAFSLLVTASPILVCSVILLGTLLIFGQPDPTKTERKKKITHDFASVRTRVSLDKNVSLERNERFSIDKFQGKGIDELSCSRYSSDPEGSIGYMPLVDDTFHYTDSERRELENKELDNQRVIHKEKLGIDGITRDVKLIEKPTCLKSDNSESSHGGGGGDDEATSSGSDRAESTSQDASIADILPILDELNPLLDLDAQLPVHISPNDSGLESDRSNDGSNESDDEDSESRSRGVQQYGPDANEEAHDAKEDESKSAIKWTEDDQMNLRDLGNLELERNRCLEKVLTMRRASKIDEKNLIDLDSSENPFNVVQISTTRQNPFDLSHDYYDDKGLPPIPSSAPSTYLPTKNPFDLLYEPNEENPELKRDHVEQECVTALPINIVFCRHQSFRPSRLGDVKQEKQDLKWRPVFVPEQFDSEETSYSSFQELPRDSSDSKLSYIPDTESASSGKDLDERKFSESVKEAEVISNIYQGSHLVNHKNHSSEDLDPLEMERSGEKDIKHDESEIKLGKVENGNASLSSTGGLIIHAEHVTTTYLRPEESEDKNSNRSSSSLSSEVDDKSSNLRKDGSNIFEPFETEVQNMSGMVDDNHHKEPVYDTSPPGSTKVVSFSSIPSDIQAEVSTVPSTAEMQSFSIFTQPLSLEDKKLAEEKSLLLSNLSKDQPSFDDHNTLPESQIIFLESEQDSGIKDENVIELQDPNMKNLLPMSAKSTSSEAIASRKKEPAGAQETTINIATEQVSVANKLKLSYSKDGLVGKGTDALDSTKEIASSNTETSIQETVSNVNVSTNDKTVSSIGSDVQESAKTPLKQVLESDQRQVSQGNLSELPKASNSKDGSLEVATANAAGPKGVQETVVAPMKKVSEVNQNETPKPSNLRGGSLDAGTNAASSTQSVQGTATTLKPVSQGDVSELPKPSNSKDGSTELADIVDPTKSVQDTTTNQEESETNFSKLPESSTSKQGSTEVRTDATDSTKMLASSDIRTIVKEGITTYVAKQVPYGNLSELPRPSHANAESAEVALGSIKSLQETVTDWKQVSEGGIHELPKRSNLKDGSTKVPITVNSTKIVQESITKQVSEGNVNELPKPSIVGSTEVDTNVVDSTKKLAPSNMGTRVQESTSAHIEGIVVKACVRELPKPSNSTDEIPKVGVDVVGTTKDIPSSNRESGVPKSVTDSEADVVVPRPNSEGHAGEVLKPSISEESNTSEMTKPKNSKESNVAEPQKPPDSKGWLWW